MRRVFELAVTAGGLMVGGVALVATLALLMSIGGREIDANEGAEQQQELEPYNLRSIDTPEILNDLDKGVYEMTLPVETGFRDCIVSIISSRMYNMQYFLSCSEDVRQEASESDLSPREIDLPEMLYNGKNYHNIENGLHIKNGFYNIAIPTSKGVKECDMHLYTSSQYTPNIVLDCH